MNIVFIGSSAFGLRCLESCINLPDIQVKGVITAPEKFAISYSSRGVTNVLHADVSKLAKSHSIPSRKLSRSMNDPILFEAITEWAPEAFLVAGWYHMIPKKWRDLAPAYGLHASLLPDYSGGAPLVWAMIRGEKKTGITLFQMNDGVDSGPIVGQKEEPIFLEDSIATLYARIEDRGLELVQEALPKLSKGKIKLRLQDESKRRIMPQRSPEDGLIDWNKDSLTIDRFIRAQTRPYPGAFTTLHGNPLHIWKAQVDTISNEEPETGRVRRTQEGKYSVVSRKGDITLYEISYEKKTYYTTSKAIV